jgi:hypothetical protein
MEGEANSQKKFTSLFTAPFFFFYWRCNLEGNRFHYFKILFFIEILLTEVALYISFFMIAVPPSRKGITHPRNRSIHWNLPFSNSLVYEILYSNVSKLGKFQTWTSLALYLYSFIFFACKFLNIRCWTQGWDSMPWVEDRIRDLGNRGIHLYDSFLLFF